MSPVSSVALTDRRSRARVRWYLRFGSYRDFEELLAERGIDVDRVTLFRWVHRFTTLPIDAAGPCRHAVGLQWLVDANYVKVTGAWRYVYRAAHRATTARWGHRTAPQARGSNRRLVAREHLGVMDRPRRVADLGPHQPSTERRAERDPHERKFVSPASRYRLLGVSPAYPRPRR
jgi:hypothetical protein